MEQPMAVGKLLIAMQQAQGGASLKGATINELESWLSEYESLKEQLGQSIAHEETLLLKSNEVRMEKKKDSSRLFEALKGKDGGQHETAQVKDLIESFTREHKDITGRMKQLEAQVDEAKVDRQQREVEVKQ
eukprot:EG_transcript_48682